MCRSTMKKQTQKSGVFGFTCVFHLVSSLQLKTRLDATLALFLSFLSSRTKQQTLLVDQHHFRLTPVLRLARTSRCEEESKLQRSKRITIAMASNLLAKNTGTPHVSPQGGLGRNPSIRTLSLYKTPSATGKETQSYPVHLRPGLIPHLGLGSRGRSLLDDR